MMSRRYNISNTNRILSFNISLSTGKKYPFKDKGNNSLKSSVIKFMKENGFAAPGYKFKIAVFGGRKLDMNKTLLTNGIEDNSNVLFIIENPVEHNINNIIKITFHQITIAGLNFDGKTKINQDTTLIKLNVGDIKGFNLFGVFDGHGKYGHFVSQFCRDYFIKAMEQYAFQCIIRNMLTPEQIYNNVKNKFIQYIIDCFRNADIEMTQQSKFDYYSSGTTCTLVIQLNKNLICANVGNSRGIIIYDNDNNKNTYRGLYLISRDHIPEELQEYQRIINNGGIVSQYIDKNGTKFGHYRIYKKGQATPGIHISRALGDLNAKNCGVINIPEIREYNLTDNSKYMVICSDGIWEIMSNEYVRDLGNIYYKKGQIVPFCTNLIQMAMLFWKNKYSDYRDDIAVVCVYFNK